MPFIEYEYIFFFHFLLQFTHLLFHHLHVWLLLFQCSSQHHKLFLLLYNLLFHFFLLDFARFHIIGQLFPLSTQRIYALSCFLKLPLPLPFPFLQFLALNLDFSLHLCISCESLWGLPELDDDFSHPQNRPREVDDTFRVLHPLFHLFCQSLLRLSQQLHLIQKKFFLFL